MTSVALRLPWVRPRQVAESARFAEGVRRKRAALDALAALPEPDRLARVAELSRWVAEYRAQRPYDYWPNGTGPQRLHRTGDPLLDVYLIGRFNFWASVDERDSAQAIEKSLTARAEGSPVLFIDDNRNTLGYDAETLARLFFPDVPQRRRPLEGAASLVSIDKARSLIAFEPEYPITDCLRQGGAAGAE